MDTQPSNSTPDLPQLSGETADTLRRLREEDSKSEFLVYVKALRNAHWPLRAIAEPLGVSRTAVSNWEREAPDTELLPPVQPLPEAPARAKKKTSVRFSLTEKQAKQLHTLAHEAAKVRRFTATNSSSRKDAKKLEELLREYTKAGASLGTLAKACKVSRSSIAQRLRKPENA